MSIGRPLETSTRLERLIVWGREESLEDWKSGQLSTVKGDESPRLSK